MEILNYLTKKLSRTNDDTLFLLSQIEGSSFSGTAATISNFCSPSRSLHIRLRDGEKTSGIGLAIPENESPSISKLSVHTKCTVREN